MAVNQFKEAIDDERRYFTKKEYDEMELSIRFTWSIIEGMYNYLVESKTCLKDNQFATYVPSLIFMEIDCK
jgi:hypothetical protein